MSAVASTLTILLSSGGLVSFGDITHGGFLMLQSSQAYRSRKMLKLLKPLPVSPICPKNNKVKAHAKLGNLAIAC